MLKSIQIQEFKLFYVFKFFKNLHFRVYLLLKVTLFKEEEEEDLIINVVGTKRNTVIVQLSNHLRFSVAG